MEQHGKAWSLEKLEKPEKSIKCYDKAIKINSNFAKAYFEKGNILLIKLKKYDEALECYQKALKINPRLVGAWFGNEETLEELERVKRPKNPVKMP
ncbi:MAG: tetratricopeptide repeat protein [Methanothermobacter tenebrarum]